MTRSQIVALLALVTAIPAVAIGAHSLSLSEDDNAPCFSAGSVGYQLTARRDADFTIKIDNAAAEPDLVLRLVDDPAHADFVLADGGETSGACAGLRTIRTIRVDAKAHQPDLTVALRPDGGANYRIYANSPDFSAQDAAALFAVMTQSGRRSAALRNMMARTDDDVTGSLTPRSPSAARQ